MAMSSSSFCYSSSCPISTQFRKNPTISLSNSDDLPKPPLSVYADSSSAPKARFVARQTESISVRPLERPGTNRPCSIWVRSGFRVVYGFINFFIGVALPFLSSLAGLLGGLKLPVTFAYPCFMWVLIKKPTKYSFHWYFNWTLGWLGVAFSIAFTIGGIWSIVDNGLKLKYFKPNNRNW